MNIFLYSTKDTDEISRELKVNFQKGLNNKDVLKQAAKFGTNTLLFKKTSAWCIFLRQFRSSFIYLLLATMVTTIFLGEMVNALMILIFVSINIGLGFFQEYRSEKTVQLLNKFSLPKARVLRMGKIEQITANKLVPGDIIILETGDKVPGDARIIEQNNLIIDETILTGESIPVYKKSEKLKTTPESYHKAINLVFSGTDVLKGKAKAIILATGKNTAFGQIAKLAGESKKISDFEKGISHFSQFILKLVGLTLFIVFIAHFLINGNNINILGLIIFSVALTVSVIPEALPLVTTFSLARGAKHLAKNKVIVKRLSAIEDLGGVEVLCSDKTGTLTKNELKITNIYSQDKEKVVFYANLGSSFEEKQKTEPFDLALEEGLNKIQKNLLKKTKRILEEPFDPKTKINLSLTEENGKKTVIMRGAPEAVINHCSNINKEESKEIDEWIANEGRQGRRVIAIAYKDDIKDNGYFLFEQVLSEKFIFSGIISFADPIKPSAFTAVKQAKQLGIRIVIITGDSREVSGAVAHKIGLINYPEEVVTGEDWEKADINKKNKYLESQSVFARISPEQKFSIINAMREKYMTGFLGEGINDVPALKVAGVSMVVESASDIAREAADIILLKKNLNVIVEGIKEGRRVFANTTKYIKSTLASNFGNFFAVAIASLLIDFLPMLPIQILLVNLLSDTPMISISTDNVETKELEAPKKYEAKDIIIIAIILGLVSMIFDFIFFGLFYRISPSVLQTNWFIGSILTELVLLFSIRTKSLFIKSLRPSSSVIWLSLATIIITIGLPFTKFGQTVFKFTAPTFYHLSLILSLVIIYFICSEIVKLTYYKNYNKTNNIT